MKIFDKIRIRIPKKNKFDLSHERKMTFNMGELLPVFVQEILPNDSFRVSPQVFFRTMPLLAPVLARVHMTIHYFYVPFRTIWNDSEDFFTGGEDGLAAPVLPYVQTAEMRTIGLTGPGYLWDYLGLPTVSDSTQDIKINSLYAKAYQFIYNEYYRDQNLQDKIDFGKTSGQITGSGPIHANWDIRKRCWGKDYLTSCLPFAQRGPAVDIPIDVSGDAPLFVSPVSPPATNVNLKADEDAAAVQYGPLGIDDTKPAGTIWARVAGLASTTTINALRRAEALQKWLEAMARGGARYAEQLINIWGKRSSDSRLQRPEYLGGMKCNLQFSEVLQTVNDVETLDGDPLGQMGGHGMGYGGGPGFKRTFEEHGCVLGIMSVLPETGYMQNVPREFSRFDKLDYPWPQFANIGEQEVLQKEVYFNGSAPGGNPAADDVFGYQSRYAECKYKPNTSHGYFKPSVDGSVQLGYWTMDRNLAGPMELNEFFVESDPTQRIFAVDADVPGVHHMIAQIYHKVDAMRPLPYFGTPTL